MPEDQYQTSPLDAKKKYFVGFILLLFLITGFALTIMVNPRESASSLSIGNTLIRIQVATTAKEQQQGLCCRDSLEPDEGMLFVYDKPGDYRFWMKDTRIPLDMYWINGEKSIVHIEENVQPGSYPKSFSSPKPAQYILETNAGFAKRHNIKSGDEVRF